jgi:hypothetical protein
MELVGFWSDHSEKALIGVIGIGRPMPAADSAVEAFEAAGGTRVFAVPGGELLFQMVVGNRRAKVTARGSDSFRLRMAIFAHDLEITTENGLLATGFPGDTLFRNPSGTVRWPRTGMASLNSCTVRAVA